MSETAVHLVLELQEFSKTAWATDVRLCSGSGSWQLFTKTETALPVLQRDIADRHLSIGRA